MRSDPASRKKQLGAYYTGTELVDFLAAWGLSHARGVAMDPSCGDGRFLAAAERLGAKEIIGCDIDAVAVEASLLALQGAAVPSRVTCRDFFTLEPDSNAKVDLVLGNPPFIRYQKFSGESRRRALESALRIGVRLTKLTSTWAPFLLHALRFLRRGGAMAFVVPAEIVQTQYGVTTLRALCANFGRVCLVTFSRNLFEDVQAETYLLLAEGLGGACTSVQFYPLDGVEDLQRFETTAGSSRTVPVEENGRVSFAEAFLEPGERAAWRDVIGRPGVERLGEIAMVTNGYVSGANDFFHRTRGTAEADGVPEEWLRPTVRNASSLSGLEFTRQDLSALDEKGRPHYLVDAPLNNLFNPFPDALHALIGEGERLGIEKRFKCRTRDPWWRVPGVHTPDIFVTYMIGRCPRASVNIARATYTNTVHGLKLRSPRSPSCVAASLHSTLSLLSMELEGRTYGGGILKLEPSELAGTRMAVPEIPRSVIGRMDRLLRSGEYLEAVELADDHVLRRLLGLKDEAIAALRSARERLVTRRYSRNRRGRS